MANHIPVDHAPLVVIVWKDAYSPPPHLSLKKEEIKDLATFAVMKTIGWLVKDEPDGVGIANECCVDLGDDTYRSVTIIPRVFIQSITPFVLSSPRKRRIKPPGLVESKEQ